MGILLSGNEHGRAAVSCRACGALIYPDTDVFAHHNIEILPDGRVHLWSTSFQMTVHLCDLPPWAWAIEQVSGVILDRLSSLGAVPARCP